ncbi:MAG: helix-turn-helix transcriptional regulator [Eubacteriales bacterium]
MQLYEKLRAYRLANGVTQTHVAKMMQMSVKKLNAIEKGRIKLSADLFLEVCKTGLKIDPASFFANEVLESKKKG